MKIIDPGYQYELFSLDGESDQLLTFVKRSGYGHSGTTTGDVIRVLLDRVREINRRNPHPNNIEIISRLKHTLLLVEKLEKKKLGQVFKGNVDDAEYGDVCNTCGFVRCEVH